jgi:hypothetical protein
MVARLHSQARRMGRRRSGKPAITCFLVLRSPGRWPGSREMRFQLLSMTDFKRTHLLPLGSLGSFGACFVIWQDQIDVAHTQCARKFKEGHDGRIPPASLQIADILLGKAGGFGKTLLGEAFFLPYPPEISADQLAHVHLRKLRLYIL